MRHVRGEILLWKSHARRRIGRYRHREENNIEKLFKKWDGAMDQTDLAEDRDRWLAVVNAVMNVRVP
jgi:hypothetical protein